MYLSTAQLRAQVKQHLNQFENKVVDVNDCDTTVFIQEIKAWGVETEKLIQQKVEQLINDFGNCPLEGEYLRSATEGFDDLKFAMKTSTLLAENLKEINLKTLFNHIKNYYNEYCTPVFNIISKLENDYIAILTNSIIENKKQLSILELKIKKFKKEEALLTTKIKTFINIGLKQKKALELKKLDLYRTWLRLQIQNDQLDLYYVNHERPLELSEIKAKAARLKTQLTALWGETDVSNT